NSSCVRSMSHQCTSAPTIFHVKPFPTFAPRSRPWRHPRSRRHRPWFPCESVSVRAALSPTFLNLSFILVLGTRSLFGSWILRAWIFRRQHSYPPPFSSFVFIRVHSWSPHPFVAKTQHSAPAQPATPPPDPRTALAPSRPDRSGWTPTPAFPPST